MRTTIKTPWHQHRWWRGQQWPFFFDKTTNLGLMHSWQSGGVDFLWFSLSNSWPNGRPIGKQYTTTTTIDRQAADSLTEGLTPTGCPTGPHLLHNNQPGWMHSWQSEGLISYYRKKEILKCSRWLSVVSWGGRSNGDWAIDIVMSEVIQNLGDLLTVFHVLCGYTDWMHFLFNGCMSIEWLLNLGGLSIVFYILWGYTNWLIDIFVGFFQL
jgi:hypothetical protein